MYIQHLLCIQELQRTSKIRKVGYLYYKRTLILIQALNNRVDLEKQIGRRGSKLLIPLI
jgi:hypothetical protein